jgi:hypothetical protein
VVTQFFDFLVLLGDFLLENSYMFVDFLLVSTDTGVFEDVALVGRAEHATKVICNADFVCILYGLSSGCGLCCLRFELFGTFIVRVVCKVRRFKVDCFTNLVIVIDSQACPFVPGTRLIFEVLVVVKRSIFAGALEPHYLFILALEGSALAQRACRIGDEIFKSPRSRKWLVLKQNLNVGVADVDRDI